MYEKIDDNIISKLHNSLMKHFHSVFYNKGNSLANSDGTPDISGYTLIFIPPPPLSAMGFDILPSSIITSRNSIFQAIEFSPPELVLNTDSIGSSSGVKIPFATNKVSGGTMSISFIENTRLDMYAFHNNWLHYIEQVVLGYMEPTQDYIDSGELDYVTSAYVMRFKPDMASMVYLGKAVGIFPIGLPSKEIIGNRQSPQLTTYSVSYMCADYREISLTGHKPQVSRVFMDNMWVLSDFIEAAAIMFGAGALEDIGSVMVHTLNNPGLSMALSETSSGMLF